MHAELIVLPRICIDCKIERGARRKDGHELQQPAGRHARRVAGGSHCRARRKTRRRQRGRTGKYGRLPGPPGPGRHRRAVADGTGSDPRVVRPGGRYRPSRGLAGLRQADGRGLRRPRVHGPLEKPSVIGRLRARRDGRRSARGGDGPPGGLPGEQEAHRRGRGGGHVVLAAYRHAMAFRERSIRYAGRIGLPRGLPPGIDGVYAHLAFAPGRPLPAGLQGAQIRPGLPGHVQDPRTHGGNHVDGR